jgi:PAS domain S-box-containing protein
MRSYSTRSPIGRKAAELCAPALVGLRAKIGPPAEQQGINSFNGIVPWPLIDALPAAIYVTDFDGRVTYFNDAAAALWGYRPKLHNDQWCGSWRLYWLDGTPIPHEQCPMAMATVLKHRRPIRGDQAIAERPDRAPVPFTAFPTRLCDASGMLVGALNMLIDISRRQSVERHLAAIVESSNDAIISKDLNGTITTWNKAAERLFGYLANEVVGTSITTLIPPDRVDEEVEILERIRRGEVVNHFETVRRRRDGGLVVVSLTVSPVTDDSGRIVGASAIARDITEKKRREEQINLLAREAEHRTKNLLAIVQATVQLAQGGTPADLKAAIKGRLRALAGTHALLAKSRWIGANLHQLVTEELSVCCQVGDRRTEINGRDLMLEPDRAEAMALALHELATNSIKYGALSAPTGRLKIEWSIDFTHRFCFQWTETGGPRLKQPTYQGFGLSMMEGVISRQLGGEVNFHWRKEGVVCEIGFDM